MYRGIKMRGKQIKIKKSIYGKDVFNSMVELAYYRKYKIMKVHESEVVSLHQAVGIAEGYIPCDSFEEELEASPDRYRVCLDTTRFLWKTSTFFN